MIFVFIIRLAFLVLALDSLWVAGSKFDSDCAGRLHLYEFIQVGQAFSEAM
jgi:hypothetical protein